MDSIEGPHLRKLIVACGRGRPRAAKNSASCSDECVARGEVTVEKGRVLNEELASTCKQAVAKDEAKSPPWTLRP